jgi:hypothetical protein
MMLLLSVPRLKIIEPASGNGRCSALASSHGAHPDSRALASSGSSALLSDIPTTQRLRFVRSRAIPRLFAFAQLCDVSNIEQRLRIRGCILILSARSLRHLPVTESIVLPLLDQGASYVVHSTQPTASPEAQWETVGSRVASSSPIPVRFFITLKPKHFSN